MLDQELLSLGPRLDLLQAQRDQTARSVSNIKVRVNLLQELVNERRLAEAEQAQAKAHEAEKEAAGKSSLIRKLAEQNAELSKQLTTLAADMERVRFENETIERQVKQIEKDFESAQQKLQIAGLSEALGKALSDQRRRLPELRQYKKRANQREDLIADIGLRQIQHSEELRDLKRKTQAAEHHRAVLAFAGIGFVPAAPQTQVGKINFHQVCSISCGLNSYRNRISVAGGHRYL